MTSLNHLETWSNDSINQTQTTADEPVELIRHLVSQVYYTAILNVAVRLIFVHRFNSLLV